MLWLAHVGYVGDLAGFPLIIIVYMYLVSTNRRRHARMFLLQAVSIRSQYAVN